MCKYIAASLRATRQQTRPPACLQTEDVYKYIGVCKYIYVCIYIHIYICIGLTHKVEPLPVPLGERRRSG